ncbi:MAG: hypothetical protein ACXU8A_05870 [Burkholderiaceae bacterium]
MRAQSPEAKVAPVIQEDIDIRSSMYPSFMEKQGWTPEQVAMCVSHQASKATNQRIDAYMGIDQARQSIP